MAYQTRTHRIYAAVTPVEYRKIQRLAKKDKISAAEWIYEATQDRLNLAANWRRWQGPQKTTAYD